MTNPLPLKVHRMPIAEYPKHPLLRPPAPPCIREQMTEIDKDEQEQEIRLWIEQDQQSYYHQELNQ